MIIYDCHHVDGTWNRYWTEIAISVEQKLAKVAIFEMDKNDP